jgi:hypothetical protein
LPLAKVVVDFHATKLVCTDPHPFFIRLLAHSFLLVFLLSNSPVWSSFTGRFSLPLNFEGLRSLPSSFLCIHIHVTLSSHIWIYGFFSVCLWMYNWLLRLDKSKMELFFF